MLRGTNRSDTDRILGEHMYLALSDAETFGETVSVEYNQLFKASRLPMSELPYLAVGQQYLLMCG